MLKEWVLHLGEGVAGELYKKYSGKCNECKTTDDLTIHHIDGRGWARKSRAKGLVPNNEIENMVVLCRRCHGSLEGKYGSDKRDYQPRKFVWCRVCGMKKTREHYKLAPKKKTGTLAVKPRVCLPCMPLWNKAIHRNRRYGEPTPNHLFTKGKDGRVISN